MDDETKQYVLDAYNKIADSFDKTRVFAWPGVIKYIDCIDKKDTIIDAGCGNGRNMLPGYKFTGMDMSESMVKLAKTHTSFPVYQGSILDMPFKDNEFDHCICIAVLHHLNTKEKRVNAIKEICRVIKKTALITVWEYDENDKKRNKKDGLIDWTLKDEIVKRYYHLFEDNELDSLVEGVSNVKIIDSYNEKNNFYMVLQKID
jgi:tRNA (uracil-5-)-methyltransferase TRM9